MRELEFTKTADGLNVMDNSVISDIPFKMTYLNYKPFADCFSRVIEMLPYVDVAGISPRKMDSMAFKNIFTLLMVYVNSRRAWVQGYESTHENARDAMKIAFASECDLVLNPDAELADQILLRDAIRHDLERAIGNPAAKLRDNLLRDISEFLNERMNQNAFVVHRVTTDLAERTIMLEEFADWRVIEWTKHQQALIDARHESI